MRVVIADDVMLARSGLARLLADLGVEVAEECADPRSLNEQAVDARRPDVAIVDIRTPAGHADDGLLAAREIRRRLPDNGPAPAHQYLDPRYAARLLATSRAGLGYLLKERVSDVAVLVDARGAERRVRHRSHNRDDAAQASPE